MGKLKVILVVIGLLVTGFVGGWLTHRYEVRKHLREVKKMHNEGSFGDYMLNAMEASEEQRSELRPILDDYAGQLKEMNRQSRQKRRLLMDSLVMEIEPLLQPGQLDHLEKFRRYVDRSPKQKKKKEDRRE